MRIAGKVNLWAQTLARYLLGAAMLPYAVSKLMAAQFQVAASQYLTPLGEVAGTTLTWAFLGYSPWFQRLLGAAELLPCVLLFFRRTQTLGAILMFPVLLNVTVINFALNLWPGTQRISAVMMALNIYLLAAAIPKFRAVFPMLLHDHGILEHQVLRRTGMAASLVFLTGGALSFVFQIRSLMAKESTDFIGDRQINRAGEWNVESFEAGRAERPSVFYFDFRNHCLYVVGSAKLPCRYSSDAAKRTFEISGMNGARTIRGTYRVEGDRLFLTGNDARITLRRTVWGHSAPPR